MTATFNLTASDYRTFRRHVLFRYRKIHWLYGGMLGLLLLFTWLGGKPEETAAERVFAWVGVVVVFGGFALIFLFILRLISRVARSRFGGTLGQPVFEISDTGLSESNQNGRIETRLSAIRRIDETSEHFFVVTTTGMGHVIPKRDPPCCDALRTLRLRMAEAEPALHRKASWPRRAATRKPQRGRHQQAVALGGSQAR